MRFLTAGESHGYALSGILEGMPSGFPIDVDRMNLQLEQRQTGYGRSDRMHIEKDTIKIISGVINGKTCGNPICIIISNRDDRNLIKDSGERSTIPRPGHVDLAGSLKYGLEDLKLPAERASGRLTAVLTALGEIAICFLETFNIKITGFVSNLGGILADISKIESLFLSNPKNDSIDELIESVKTSQLRCPDKTAEKKMIQRIDQCISSGETLGGAITVLVYNAPVGLGSYVHWDRRLDGKLAYFVMSIPGIKSVEIGDGSKLSYIDGSHAQDEIYWDGKVRRRSNHCGGIEGGISNGEVIILKAAMKPIPTVRKGLSSIDIYTKEQCDTNYVRSDTCAVPAASVVAESMVSLCLLEAFLEKFGADTYSEIISRFNEYNKSLDKMLKI